MTTLKNILKPHSKLYFLLVMYLLLATGYNIIFPTLNADDADETAHFRYIHWISEQNRLPTTTEERRQAGVRAKDGYPPFYQILTAMFASSWDDGGDTAFIRQRNDTAVLVREVRNGHWLFHTIAMQLPYEGPFLLWHLGRLFSSLLGALTIALTYFLTLELFPNRRSLAILAAASIAFIPRFVFTTSNLSDDPLLAALMAGYLLVMMRILKTGGRWFHFVLVGLLLGLGLVTKLSVAPIPVVAVLFLAFVARRQHWGWPLLIQRLVLIGAAAIVISSWWPVFTIWNFSEIEEHGLLIGVFNAVVPDVASNITGAELLYTLQGVESDVRLTGHDSYLDWLIYFTRVFWEVYINVADRFLVLDQVIWLSWLLFGLAAVGFALSWPRLTSLQRTALGFLLLHLAALLPLMLIRHAVNGASNETAQARHLLMPGAAAVGLLLAIGWSYYAQPRSLRWLRPLMPGLLLFWSVAQLNALYYFYPSPLPVAIDAAARQRVPEPDVQISQKYFDAVELIGYKTTVNPTKLTVTLIWESHKPTAKDYLTEVVLLNANGQIVSNWLGYSANGGYPTRAWYPGDQVFDEIELPIFDLPPGSYTIEAFLVDTFTEPRQRVTEALFIAPVKIADTAPPTGLKTLNFDTASGLAAGQYQVWPFDFFRFGQPLYRYRSTISIAWADPGGADFRFKLVAPDSQEFLPVTPVGNLKNFIVDPQWPSGLYRLKIEVVENGQLLNEVISPYPLRVENKFRQFDPPLVQRPLNANFGDTALLLGYDLPKTRYQPGEILSIPTHWQSLQVTPHKLRIYNRLYDLDHQLWVVSDHDTPPLFETAITWVPGQVVTGPSKMWLDSQVPPGIYTIHYGLYIPQDQDGDRVPDVQNRVDLPLIIDNQMTDIYFIELGPIKLGRPNLPMLVDQIQPQYTRQDRLGDVIELNGYNLNYQADSNRLDLVLYWESLDLTDQDWTTFIHLRDEQDQVISQIDGPPGGLTFPTSLWDPGEIIKHDTHLPLPADLPPGNYHLVVGLYNLATGQRLFVPDSTNNEIVLQIWEFPL